MLLLRPIALLILAGSVLSVTGCSWLRKPNLGRIYQEVRQQEPPHPVILIPGFLGSKLKQSQTNRVAWGRILDIFGGGRKERFALPIHNSPLSANVDDLVAYDIYDSAAGSRYYGEILAALERHGGYRRGEISDPQEGENCFVFYYDWRRGLVESARKLGEAIEGIQTALGKPDLKVDLIAHSMGGLIARYYVLYGKEDVLGLPAAPSPSYRGGRNVDRIVLIGTPNEGSINSLKVLNQGLKKVVKPVSVGEVFTMPSLFQMLPAPGTWPIVDEEGNPLQIDIYDAANWEKYGWSAFQLGEGQGNRRNPEPSWTVREMRLYLERVLERASRFYAAMHPLDPGSSPTEFITFGSDCTPTLEKAVLRPRENGSWEILFQEIGSRYNARWARLREVLFLPGDGVVTRNSLLSLQAGWGSPEGDSGPLSEFHYAYFLCSSHGLLTRDVMFQNNLFYVLRHGANHRTSLLSGGIEGL